MLVGNKFVRDSERAVSREEGLALAKELGCLLLECSAKTRENVEKCFEELALKKFQICDLASSVKADKKVRSILEGLSDKCILEDRGGCRRWDGCPRRIQLQELKSRKSHCNL